MKKKNPAFKLRKGVPPFIMLVCERGTQRENVRKMLKTLLSENFALLFLINYYRSSQIVSGPIKGTSI